MQKCLFFFQGAIGRTVSLSPSLTAAGAGPAGTRPVGKRATRSQHVQQFSIEFIGIVCMAIIFNALTSEYASPNALFGYDSLLRTARNPNGLYKEHEIFCFFLRLIF